MAQSLGCPLGELNMALSPLDWPLARFTEGSKHNGWPLTSWHLRLSHDYCPIKILAHTLWLQKVSHRTTASRLASGKVRCRTIAKWLSSSLVRCWSNFWDFLKLFCENCQPDVCPVLAVKLGSTPVVKVISPYITVAGFSPLKILGRCFVVGIANAGTSAQGWPLANLNAKAN